MTSHSGVRSSGYYQDCESVMNGTWNRPMQKVVVQEDGREHTAFHAEGRHRQFVHKAS